MGNVEPFILYTAVGLALAALIVAMAIAARYPAPLSPPMEKVHDAALAVFNYGSIAVFGLLGYKMLK